MKKELSLLLLIALAGSALIGCGSQKFSNGSDSGSTTQSSTSTSARATKCSHDVDNLSDLSMRLKVYEDSYAGLRSDLIRVKFDRFPTTFSSNDDAALQVWTRTVDTNGNWGSWHKLSFFLERYTTTGIQRTPYKYTDITWSQLKQVSDSFGMGTSLSANEFFGSVVLLVQLDDASNVSKALTVKVYDTVSPETTALIPQFLANPREYAKTHPSVLQALHPLQSLYNAAYTEDQFMYEANQFCF